MNIIEVARKENLGKKYKSYNNGKPRGIWILKEEAENMFELYNEYESEITDSYCVSEIASLEFEEVIDWSKVPVDTKVVVSKDNKLWFRRYFAKYEDGRIYCFRSGASSFSADDEDDIMDWKYVKLYQK